MTAALTVVNGGHEVPTRTMALAPRSFAEAKDQADALARADGFVPRSALGKPASVLAALMTGAELGIGPMEALRSIHVIEGKPTLSAEFMLARAIRAGVVHQWLSLSADEAKVKLTRPGFEPMTLAFTMAEAKAAGVTNKDNWRKYPAAMLRARCISAALRAYCPDVLGAGIYTAEEMGAETDEGGSPIVVERAPERVMDASPRNEPPPPQQRATKPKLSECETTTALADWIASAGRKAYDRKPAETIEKVTTQAESIAARMGMNANEADVYVRGALEALGHVEQQAEPDDAEERAARDATEG